MSLDKIESYIQKFNAFNQWEDRYREIINIGKSLEPLDDEFKVELNRIKGCQSQVWLTAEYNDGKVFFKADSDSFLVKGIIGILVDVYSGMTPKEILDTGVEFLSEIGITEHLSMNRTNGLASMIKQIKFYAMAFEAKYKN